MISRIGPSTYASSAGTGPSAAVLQARLDRYQKELSDCVNCSSANTREGRENIQALSNKISETKARIEDIATSGSNTRPAADINANKDVFASGSQDNSPGSTIFASGFAATTVGLRLDVFA